MTGFACVLGAYLLNLKRLFEVDLTMGSESSACYTQKKKAHSENQGGPINNIYSI